MGLYLPTITIFPLGYIVLQYLSWDRGWGYSPVRMRRPWLQLAANNVRYIVAASVSVPFRYTYKSSLIVL